MSDTLDNKIISLSQLQEYDKQRQAHLPVELNELNKHTVCTFNITDVNTTIRLQNLTNMSEINWGDGTIDTNLSHTYTKIGEYTCVIKGVESIGMMAFPECPPLTSIEIPDSVTSIGSMAFEYCSLLTSITIGNNVTSIQGGAFSGCSSLTSIVIPDSVTSISNCVFSGCSSLTSIVIPDSVTSIDSMAFSGCSSLTSIEVKAKTIPSIATDAIPSTIEKIIVPIESIQLYKEATNWVQYADKIVSIVDTNYLEEKNKLYTHNVIISALAESGGSDPYQYSVALYILSRREEAYTDLSDLSTVWITYGVLGGSYSKIDYGSYQLLEYFYITKVDIDPFRYIKCFLGTTGEWKELYLKDLYNIRVMDELISEI